ncbi:hypothetical protein BCR35DRAFT_323600 [Leucosporidium creatinivorum]|uniref:F-box domain-containing protein n=1 Tax=Leucosporidium creatinivorum TaxID=106004 RepID=A0A1Y2G215_9BASI|nr:hypothetical protein BCR35DRAFT_323600 [Leucosporidium creatinivorum]
MAAPECLTLDSDSEGNEMELSTKRGDMSDPSKSPEPLPKKTLLSLPDELLSAICGHLEYTGHRKDLQLSAKRFYSLCRPWIWREVSFEENFDDHDNLMCHLVTTSLAALVRSADYHLTSPFSKSLALLLSTNLTSITQLTLSPNFEDEDDDDDDDDQERKTLPKALTVALKSLPALRSLKLYQFHEVEDTAFSIATELPHLTSLAATTLIIAESLFKNGPTLRSLEIRLNDFGCAAIVACAETLHSLILHRDLEEAGTSIAQNKCLNQLRLLFDPMRNKHHAFPLQSLTLEHFELLETRDNLVRPHPRLMEFLSALKGTSLSTLRLEGFTKVKCSANDDPGFGLFLPTVKDLELSLAYQGSEHCSLDQESILFLRSLLRCFPNATGLALDNWMDTLDPRELASLQLLELGIYSPIFYLLLEPLRRTELLEIKLSSSVLWDTKSLRLLREEDGFARELLSTDWDDDVRH